MLSCSKQQNIDELIKRIEALERGLKGSIPAIRNEAPATRQKAAKTKDDEKREPVQVQAKEEQEQPPKAELPETESNKPEKAIAGNLDDEGMMNAIVSGWQAILKKIRSENAGLQAIIRECKIKGVINKKAVFEFDPKFTFHINAANQPKNKEKFKEILKSYLNSDCEVEFIIKNNDKPAKPKQTIEDIYEDLKNEFGEDKVEFQEE
jgi:hypothetical protein